MNFRPIYSVIKERKITLFIGVIILFFGMYSYYLTPKQEFPDVSAPLAVITTSYPGASPDDVEKLVTRKIEDAVAEITGYDYATSNSRNSMAQVVLHLDQSADIKKAWDELDEKMDEVQNELPDECGAIQMNTDLMEMAGMIISMSGENYSHEELGEYADYFIRELSKIEGVSRFDITGKQEKEVKIDVDIQQLNYYSISLEDIIGIIQAQNIEIPSGAIETDQEKISVQIPQNYESIEDIKDTIIAGSKETGAVVRLGEIADVSKDYEDSNYKIMHNGENAVLLTGYFQPNENIVIIGEEVEKKIEELKADLPRDISFDEVIFQPDEVKDSVNNFLSNLLQGVLFVVMVVFIGMGFRNALVVSTSIPLSILATFSAMYVLGIQIHQISIAALIIALGMLVDNAIVVTDAIQVRLDHGEEKMKACIEGVKEIAVPIFTSTLTTIGAFIPLLLLDSAAGRYIRAIPQIVGIALFASYLTALFIIPAMSYIFFKPSKIKEKDSKIRKSFQVLLRFFMKYKIVMVLLIGMILYGTGLIIQNLPLQFFPQADKDIVYVDITTEKNGDLSRTEEITEEVTKILESQEEVISYTAVIGNGLPKFHTTMPVTTAAQNAAQIMLEIQLKMGEQFKSNSEFVRAIQAEIDQQIVGATVKVNELSSGPGTGTPIKIRVAGSDKKKIQEVGKQIENNLRDISGTYHVENDQSIEEYAFSLKIDTDKAALLGISKYDIEKEVSIALRGGKASVYREEGEEYDINVKGHIQSIEVLGNLAIKSSFSGQKILLKDIADIELSSKQPVIKKYDRENNITISSELMDGYSSGDIQAELKEKINTINTDDVSIIFDGENKTIKDNFGDLGNSSVFAVIVIYGILLFQFRSFIQPLMILMTIPLAAVGSIFGLHIVGLPLSFTALLGIVSLMGIVINNAIVLVDYINAERNSGKEIKDACFMAVEKRFRPIMLSTTTTVIGLIPLAIFGGELFQPMAVTLMSGLMISTILTLIVIPIIYYMIENWLRTLSNNK